MSSPLLRCTGPDVPHTLHNVAEDGECNPVPNPAAYLVLCKQQSVQIASLQSLVFGHGFLPFTSQLRAIADCSAHVQPIGRVVALSVVSCWGPATTTDRASAPRTTYQQSIYMLLNRKVGCRVARRRQWVAKICGPEPVWVRRIAAPCGRAVWQRQACTHGRDLYQLIPFGLRDVLQCRITLHDIRPLSPCGIERTVWRN